MAGTVEKTLLDLGVELPIPAKAIANYVPYTLSDNHLYISGQLPLEQGKILYEGALGAGVRLEEGQSAARLCAINILAQVKSAIIDLDKIQQLVKMTGFICATPEFQDHPKVMNGASDFMVEVLGEKGRHSRSAVGCSSLPMEAAVEVEAIFRVMV